MARLRLVLDTNILMAALISRQSSLRDVLVSDKVEFLAPELLIEEIEAHKAEIKKASGLSENEFYFTLYFLLRQVKIIKRKKIEKHLKPAMKIIGQRDPDDAVFLALALAIPNDGIFSQDVDFDVAPIKRWKIKEVLAWLKGNE